MVTRATARAGGRFGEGGSRWHGHESGPGHGVEAPPLRRRQPHPTKRPAMAPGPSMKEALLCGVAGNRESWCVGGGGRMAAWPDGRARGIRCSSLPRRTPRLLPPHQQKGKAQRMGFHRGPGPGTPKPPGRAGGRLATRLALIFLRSPKTPSSRLVIGTPSFQPQNSPVTRTLLATCGHTKSTGAQVDAIVGAPECMCDQQLLQRMLAGVETFTGAPHPIVALPRSHASATG